MYRSILRLGFAIAATMAVSSSAYASSIDRTVSVGPSAWPSHSIVIGYADHAFDISPLKLFSELPPRAVFDGGTVLNQHTFAIKASVAGAAVLATTQAGWRSGRLRKLSG